MNNLIYYFKGENNPQNFIGFEAPLSFLKKIRDKDRTLKDTKESQKEFKSDLNAKAVARYESSKQESAIEKIGKLYDGQGKLI